MASLAGPGSDSANGSASSRLSKPVAGQDALGKEDEPGPTLGGDAEVFAALHRGCEPCPLGDNRFAPPRFSKSTSHHSVPLKVLQLLVEKTASIKTLPPLHTCCTANSLVAEPRVPRAVVADVHAISLCRPVQMTLQVLKKGIVQQFRMLGEVPMQHAVDHFQVVQ